MTQYEFLDLICDSVNPIAFFVAVSVAFVELKAKQYWCALRAFGFLCGGLALVYALLFADAKIKLWGFFGGDYSTHTAFALATGMAISAVRRWDKWLLLVFVLYVIAMRYQQYHTIFDIFSTAVVVGAPLLLAVRHVRKQCVKASLRSRQLELS